MEITIKKTTEKKINIPCPSYWKGGDDYYSVLSEKKAIKVTLNELIGRPCITTCSPDVWLDGKEEQVPQIEFMKAYNKAHEDIEELILSVETIGE